MIRFAKAFAAAVLAFALFSCATTSIETNKDAANLKPLSKVYIVVNTGDVKMIGGTVWCSALSRPRR